jgi:hypothetical protein
MNKLTITNKVFVPVSVNDELPECDSQHNRCYLSKRVGIITDEGVDSTQYYREYSKDGEFKSEGWNNQEEFGKVHAWLKEETNRYVLTESELRELLNKTWEANHFIWAYDEKGIKIDNQMQKENYINLILNKYENISR